MRTFVLPQVFLTGAAYRFGPRLVPTCGDDGLHDVFNVTVFSCLLACRLEDGNGLIFFFINELQAHRFRVGLLLFVGWLVTPTACPQIPFDCHVVQHVRNLFV